MFGIILDFIPEIDSLGFASKGTGETIVYVGRGVTLTKSHLGARLQMLYGAKIKNDLTDSPRFKNTPKDAAECAAEVAFTMRQGAAIRSSSEMLAAARSGTN